MNPQVKEQSIDPEGKGSPSGKEELEIKKEEQTAEKNKESILTENQKTKIRNELFALFKHSALRGKIKIQ